MSVAGSCPEPVVTGAARARACQCSKPPGIRVMRVVGPGRSLEAAVSCVFSVPILHSLLRAGSAPDRPRAQKAPDGRPAKVTAEPLPASRAEQPPTGPQATGGKRLGGGIEERRDCGAGGARAPAGSEPPHRDRPTAMPRGRKPYNGVCLSGSRHRPPCKRPRRLSILTLALVYITLRSKARPRLLRL